LSGQTPQDLAAWLGGLPLPPVLDEPWLFYPALCAPILAYWYVRRRRLERESIARQREAQETGLDEPPSLHPVIDPVKCIGCGACAKACPEGDILGMIRGKAELVQPSHCIGHGACRAACPVGAITLVFGTERRGVELPHVGPDFQTNVPGIYIAGELGGMGLIRNAIEQGRQAVSEITRRLKSQGRRGELDYDLAIVGGGPAGISASLAAKLAGLRFVTIEQQTLGGTVSHYPRGKVVMTQPAELPGHGKMKFREVNKETLLAFWTDVIAKAGLRIDYDERVDAVQRSGSGFELRTSRRTLSAANVLLAIGRRGTPRTLGVPGEELDKVVYRMIDPEQYAGRRVLVVGGGDSALEAAATLAEETDATVALIYRGKAFQRAKRKNIERVEAARTSGRLRVSLETDVQRIDVSSVTLVSGERVGTLANDDVIVCAGGVLPSSFLREIGIDVEVRHGT
jgi:thioredoxin reductase/Pyruvate/2-oxoacid:ferredoxin oxidoreductase delta subunit